MRCRQVLKTVFAGGLAALVGLSGGCTHKVVQSTPYFVDGPSQLDPPQGDLDPGIHVLALDRTGSYRRVLTLTGVNAYVLESALEPLWPWGGGAGGDAEPVDD